jgi:hypothetical protein
MFGKKALHQKFQKRFYKSEMPANRRGRRSARPGRRTYHTVFNLWEENALYINLLLSLACISITEKLINVTEENRPEVMINT